MLWHFSTFLEHNSGVRLREMQAVDSSRSNSDAFHFKNTRVTEVKKTTVEFTMMHTALRAGRALVATRNAAWKRVAWHGDGRCGDSFYLPMQEWCCTSQTTHPSFPLSLPLYTCNKNAHCCTAFFPPSTCLFLSSVAKTSVAAVLLDFSLLPLNSPTRGAL